MRFVIVILFALSAWIVWRWSPLASYASPEMLEYYAQAISGSRYAMFIVAGSYVAASIVLFPITAMFLLTALALPPLEVFFAGLLGVAASGLTGYAGGRLLGREPVRRLLGGSFNRVERLMKRSSLISVAVARNVPIAPYTVVNLVIGSLSVPVWHFVAGNVLGLFPGLLTMTFLGYQVRRMWENPTLADAGLMAGLMAASLLLSLVLQRLVNSRSSAAVQ